MKKVKISVEFAMPDIESIGLSNEEEIGLAEETRRLFPGKVLKEILLVLNDAGAEIVSYQKQEIPDYMFDIVRSMDGEKKIRKTITEKMKKGQYGKRQMETAEGSGI